MGDVLVKRARENEFVGDCVGPWVKAVEVEVGVVTV